MSQTLHERLEKLGVHHVDPEEARRILATLAEDHNPDFDKGADIAKRIISEHLIAGRRPMKDPIFSLSTPNDCLSGFLSVFGEDVTLDTLHNSPAAVVSSCAVELRQVNRTSELLPHEKEFMVGRLPAVRIEFIPQEM